MKKLLCNRMWQRLGVCMTGMLLALGITIWLGGATPVQAAGEIPISSAEDFMNMESNPAGSYYLTNDITLPPNMKTLFSTYDVQFTGTLDGNGHELKNYTFQSSNPEGDSWIMTSLFGYAKNATFKNFSITNVNINIDAGNGGAAVHPLVFRAESSKFDKIKVSGKIAVKSSCTDYNGSDLAVCGLVGTGDRCNLTNCSSSLKITVNGGHTQSLNVSGLGGTTTGTVKNCTFSGDISASAKTPEAAGNGYTAAGICTAFSNTKVSGCTNSGNITINIQKGGSSFGTSNDSYIGAYGIGGGSIESMSSCKNTGKIKTTVASDIIHNNNAAAAGLVESVYGGTSKNTITKCWNKGSVSVTGRLVYAGGICIKAAFIDQCYNKGAVYASGLNMKGNEQLSEIGGLCMRAYRMQNCYNVGKVALKGSGYAGGLASSITLTGNNVSIGNYSTGAVSVKNGGRSAYRAALFPRGELSYAMLHPKCYIYNNYYKASTGCTAYGLLKGKSKTAPRAEKVSSITSKNCPKLSSKYWTYSSKYKRMVLKNNKEK